MHDDEQQSELSRELEKVDRRIRIERLKRDAEEISGGAMITSGSHEDPPYDRDQYLPKRDYRQD